MPQFPLYTVEINDDLSDETGVTLISVVGDPAIKANFEVFNENGGKPSDGQILKFADKMNFKATEECQIVAGPALIPGILIYRDDINGSPGVMTFSREVIAKIAAKFARMGNQFQTNFDHVSAYAVECSVSGFITKPNDSARLILGYDLPEGSWFVSMYIPDQAFFSQHVKTGHVKGFSVEAFLNQIKIAEAVNVPLSKQEPVQPTAHKDDLILFKSCALNGAFKEVDFTISPEAQKAAQLALSSMDTNKLSAEGRLLARQIAEGGSYSGAAFGDVASMLADLDDLNGQAVGGFQTALWAHSVALECQTALFLERNPMFLARNRSAFDKLFDDLTKKAALRWVRQIRAFAAKTDGRKAKAAMALIESLQEALSADDAELILSKYGEINQLFA